MNPRQTGRKSLIRLSRPVLACSVQIGWDDGTLLRTDRDGQVYYFLKRRIWSFGGEGPLKADFLVDSPDIESRAMIRNFQDLAYHRQVKTSRQSRVTKVDRQWSRR